MIKTAEWILCPVCGSKTRLQIRGDTELKNFPLYCPKCKQETLINAKELHIIVIKKAYTQAINSANNLLTLTLRYSLEWYYTEGVINMRTVKEVSKLTGVSVRTLHYYDAIGLLKPTKVTEAGYRMYDDAALSRLQNILLFRELQFPLKEIKVILDSPNFNQEEAIAQQIRLLELQYKHIGELISFAREIQSKGVRTMNFEVFDTNEIEQYKSEVKAKWGHSKAYQEYEKRAASHGENNYVKFADEIMSLFTKFGTMKQLPPTDKAVQEKVAVLQSYINENFYTCNNEILKGLGEMYVCDERFKKNIDCFGGEGTAEFVRQAIFAYCDK